METEHALQGLEQRAMLAVDLSYEVLAVANNALPGGTITVNSTLMNTGDEDLSTPFMVRFYLSDDATLDGGDTALGDFQNTVTIPHGGTRGFAKDLVVPGGTAGGSKFIIGVADVDGVIAETNEGNNTLTGTFFVGNTPPSMSMSDFIIGPPGMTRTSELTLLVISATDTDGVPVGGTVEVGFWYDFDDDGVLSEVADRFIGAGTNAAGTPSFAYTGAVPTYFRAGSGTIFARAFDGLDSTTVSQSFMLATSTQPVVQAVSTTPTVAIWGQNVTFNATGVSDPDDAGTVQTVNLYRDSNGTAGLQGDDELIGAMTRDGTTDRWFLTTLALPAWGVTSVFIAQATDSMSRTGEGSGTVSFASTDPVTIGSVTGITGAVRRGRPVTLTANGVSNNAQVVKFFRDSNGNGSFDPGTDQLLGNAAPTGGSASLEFTIDPAWGAGDQRFFVQGADALGTGGEVEIVDADLITNRTPRVASVTANATTRSKGQTLILTANNVTDDDGATGIANVQFFRDSNRNGQFDATTDVLLGNGTRIGTTNNYQLSLVVPASFRNGLNKIFVKATDIVGAKSPTRSVDVTATRNLRPTIATFNVTPASASIGQQITLLASGVADNGAIGSVRFFHDSNGNGQLDLTTDTLIGNGGRVGPGNYRRKFRLPAGFDTGTQRFFAVAFDNLNVRSTSRADTVLVNA